MPRSLVPALLSLTLLSACGGHLGGPPPAPIVGGAHSQSVGFSGVGGDWLGSVPSGENQRVAVPQHAVSASTGANTNGLTMIKVTTRLKSRSDIAKLAIQRGSRVNAPSTPITIAGQALSFSLVEVNGRRFAVLNKSQGFLGSGMTTGTQAAFASQVPQLTGCTAEGGAYGYGQDRNRPIGIAIPLSCG